MTINKESECVTRNNCKCVDCVRSKIDEQLCEYQPGEQIWYTLMTVGRKSSGFIGSNVGPESIIEKIDNSIELMETFIEKQLK